MVGSGIFASPGVALERSGSSGLFLLAWLGAGGLVYCSALSYMELAALMPQQAPQPPEGGGAPSPQDPTGTGGGNIAPGNAPEPGAPGFTGAGGGANTPPPEEPQG